MRCTKDALVLTKLVAIVLFGACLCLLLHMRLLPRSSSSMEPIQSLNPLPCHPWPSPSDFFLPHSSKDDAAFDPAKRSFYADHWLSPEVCSQVDSFVRQAILLRRPLLEKLLNRSVDTTALFRHFQENGHFLDWLKGDVLRAHVVPGTKAVVLFTVVSISSQARGDFVEFIRNWIWNVEKAMPAGTVPLVVCTAQSCVDHMVNVTGRPDIFVLDKSGFADHKEDRGPVGGEARRLDPSVNIKYSWIYHMLRLGYEPLFSDVDLAIAKDPLPLLLAEGQEPFVADVQVQVDALDKDPSTWYVPREVRMRAPYYFTPKVCGQLMRGQYMACQENARSFCLNTGFMFFRANVRSLLFASHLVELLEWQWDTWWEQHLVTFLADVHTRLARLKFDWMDPMRINNDAGFENAKEGGFLPDVHVIHMAIPAGPKKERFQQLDLWYRGWEN